MPDFIRGRMEVTPVSAKSRAPTENDTTIEHSQYRSGVGNAHWVTSQYRIDKAMEVNLLQKQQSQPTVADLRLLAKTTKELQESADFELRIQKLKMPLCVVGWTDTALYGTTADVNIDEIDELNVLDGRFRMLQNDADVKDFDKHKVRSQAGSLVGSVSKEDLASLDAVPFNVCDYRTRASHRTLVSTFSAESSAALETHGLVAYSRAMLCEVLGGHARMPLTDYNEDHLATRLVTDCRSLYDHLKSDGKVPDDRHTAIWIAALRGGVGAGPGIPKTKTPTMWVASRWQLADCLTKLGLDKAFRQILTTGKTRFHEPSAQAIKRSKQEEGV
jgi:hypothetical protein